MIDLKTFFLAVVTALAIGFGAGYYTHKQFAKADQVGQLQRDRKDSAEGIVESLKTDQKVEKKVAQADAAAAATQASALARVNAQLERRNDELEKQVSKLELDGATKDALLELCADPRLDAGTVRLLNAARERPAVEPARGSHAAGQAATQAP